MSLSDENIDDSAEPDDLAEPPPSEEPLVESADEVSFILEEDTLRWDNTFVFLS